MAGAIVGGNVELIFEDLVYGSALDGESVALKWLEANNKTLGHFINGQWVHPEVRQTVESRKPTGEILAVTLEATSSDIYEAVSSSSQAFSTWSSLSPDVRSRYLYSIARNLQKHQSLIAVVEAIDAGKPTRETKNVDIPAIIRQFYHFAGWAQLRDKEMIGWKPYGVVAVLPDGTFPLMQLASRAAPALAMGNTVVVMPSTKTRLSALLFAQVCAQAGLPKGVLNVVTGSSIDALITNPEVKKVAFSGSVSSGKKVRTLTAGLGKSLSLELSGWSPILVFEDADLDSAVEGITEAAFFNNGQSNHAGSRLLIQEPVYNSLIKKLELKISKLTVGDNLEKNNDQGPLTDPQVVSQLEALVQSAQSEGGKVYRPDASAPNNQNYFPPTLITGIQTSSQAYLEEVSGPLLVAVPFRTVKEGLVLANHSVYGTSASLWTENISVALEAASQLQVATVWVNTQNIFDAASGVGGNKSSGFGRSGGKECLYEYVQPSWLNVPSGANITVDMKKFGATVKADPLPGTQVSGSQDNQPSIDKTYKLFYGGGQKRPDSGASIPALSHKGEVLGYVPDGGRKDIRNAVEVAVKAASSWGRKEGHGKAQIMYYIAENLQSRQRELVQLLVASTGQAESEAVQEVETAIQRLFYWAAYCDKYGGSLQETPFYGYTVLQHEPVGVVGIVCPEKFPFLGFISLIAPAIARGNAVIAVPSEKYPLAALSFHQILETSDVPGGVVNIMTGDKNVLTKSLAEHHDVNALWYFGSAEGSKFVEAASAGNLKRTWVSYDVERDFLSPEQGQGEDLLYHSTSCKNIWLPMGDIFAN
ncbi:aldehyde dehydrogenase family 16 member A1-like [Physella acuta]|uniref:aldehyde dehydrogenase family 16 member A1-like n=1 Tax=Physella acuta TaxID=109671 RepID=UPI0027DB8345|nr:aldehyde dehydrogenase family 16 member A1-like [Physella acuta]